MLPLHQTVVMVGEHVHVCVCAVCGSSEDGDEPPGRELNERQHGRPGHPGPAEAAPRDE